jgi:hypothetical protein
MNCDGIVHKLQAEFISVANPFLSSRQSLSGGPKRDVVAVRKVNKTD